MKIAIITDVHSNFHGLSAVLNDIENEKPDFIVGGGDMVGCSAYCGTLQVWNTLHNKKIPSVLGNEEERIIRFFSADANTDLTDSVQFMPLRYRAKQFSSIDIQTMRTLPMNINLEGPQGNDVLVCHASPNNINKSPMQGIDAQMEKELHAVRAKVIVSGHYHSVWHRYWKGKLLIMAGSAGLPLRGNREEVDYLILTYGSRAWQFEYKTVKYDFRLAIKEIIESNFLELCGPIGWLMFDEALSQEDRLTPFLGEYGMVKESRDLDDWKRLVIDYLENLKRWETIQPYIKHLL